MTSLTKLLSSFFNILTFLFFLKTKPISAAASRPAPPASGIRAAYWPSFNDFPASAINTSLFTHVYYAFLGPDPTTYELNLTSSDQQKLPELVKALRSSSSSSSTLKVMFSIGGGGFDPKVFARMAGDESSRAVFIKSTIDVARRFRFDGVDLDWEFPADVKDMENLGLLFQQWRRGLEDEAVATRRPRLLLTAAVYYAYNITLLDSGKPRAYPAEAIAKYVDWVSPMCFDYHGTWDKVTGMHSALNDPKTVISTNFGIRSWIRAGVPRGKIVMGLPAYGRTWKLQDSAVNGIGAPAVGAGPGEDGTMVYNKIVDFNAQNKATVRFDPTTASYYSYAGDSWIGYDDARSISLKVDFAKSLNLGGYFFWALGQDKNWALSTAASNSWRRR